MQLEYTDSTPVMPHCLVYGPAKSGKTRLIKTLQQPFICNTDMGLASIRDCKFPKKDCHSYPEVQAVLNWLKSGGVTQFKEIVFDDFSEMCALYIKDALQKNKDGRKAYFEMATDMLQFIRDVRLLANVTVVLIAKQERITTSDGRLLYSPMVPGQALQPLLAYYVGQIYRMETWTNPADNVTHEVLRCKRTDDIEAGDRSGRLDPIEYANLGAIIQKTLS